MIAVITSWQILDGIDERVLSLAKPLTDINCGPIIPAFRLVTVQITLASCQHLLIHRSLIPVMFLAASMDHELAVICEGSMRVEESSSI